MKPKYTPEHRPEHKDVLSSTPAGEWTEQGTAIDINLSAWHADPQPDAAARLSALSTTHNWNERLEALRLRLMLGLPADMQRDVLWSEAKDDMQRAAVELITGQVMLARRLQGAWGWLDAAEKRLAHRLPGPDYLEMLGRHAALRALSLFDQPKTIRPLEELLAIANATSRIEGLKRPGYTIDRRDTLG
jgi:hypothetical protein